MEEISLDVDAQIQLLAGQALDGIPVIGYRKLVTHVQLKPGEWAVVGGLLSGAEARALAGIAGLSSLPGIGPLMRQTTKTRDKTEVLVLIKTNLLSVPPNQFVSQPIPIGTETRPRAPR
jgi:type II secretory pathway component GspD/PulD (secretin)